MKTIVFGATGFIGSHVAEQLIAAGHSVTAPVRSASNTDFLQHIGADITRIDFSSDDALTGAIKDHPLVFNCVANPRMHQPIEQHRAVDVVLSRRLVEAAARAAARRFVQLSTVQVYGFSRPPTPIDEDYPCDQHYAFTRVAQQREAEIKQAADKAGLEWVMVRPVNTLGQRDTSMKPLIDGHKQGLLVIFGDGNNRWSFIDTRDVGRAMVWLGELPEAAGHSWLVSGGDTSWHEVKVALDRARGGSSRLLRIPASAAKWIARLLENLLPYSVNLSLTPFAVDVMSSQTLFDDSRIRETGFKPKYSLQDMIDACVSG